MEGSEATASVIDPLGADIKPGPSCIPNLLRIWLKLLGIAYNI